MKQCKVCKEEKPLDQFHSRQAKCKPCDYEYRKQYRKNNKDKTRKWEKKWLEKNKESYKAIKLKSYYNRKDEHYSVYLLPDHHYVGITGCVSYRMNVHRSQHGRNTDNVQILHTFKTRKEALAKEAEYHKQGFLG